MKQEEMSDMCTILVEEQDRHIEVIDQVRKQHKPVVIVVSEQAAQVFQGPDDFRELKRARRECGIPVTLVLSGHERMRNWARRQGFTVYASAETCAKALARRDRLNALRGIAPPYDSKPVMPLLSDDDEDDEEDDALWSWEHEEPPDEKLSGSALSSQCAALDSAAWRMTGGNNVWEPSWPVSDRTTDGMVSLAWQGQIAQHGRSTVPLHPTRLVADGESGAVHCGEGVPVPQLRQAPVTEPLHDNWSGQHEKVAPRGRSRGHTLALVLTILLILGILGGIGFGYVLSLLHAAPGAFPL